jgi:hypothetical protein
MRLSIRQATILLYWPIRPVLGLGMGKSSKQLFLQAHTTNEPEYFKYVTEITRWPGWLPRDV